MGSPNRSLKSLENLEICGGRVSNAGVRYISKMSSLRLLVLRGHRRITNCSVPFITKLTGLVSLNLSQCNLTGQGIRPLAEMPVSPPSLKFTSPRVPSWSQFLHYPSSHVRRSLSIVAHCCTPSL